MTGLPWDASYQDGPAPWDTGRPQPAVVRLAAGGRFAGAVLDAGCGTGENALHIAAPGAPVLGFDGAERPGYLASLASVTEHGGTLYVLCFSDEGPDTGPHPVSQEELGWAFRPDSGWTVVAIEPDRVQTRFHDANGAPAWLATVKRI
jgi:hypothetical protein